MTLDYFYKKKCPEQEFFRFNIRRMDFKFYQKK